MATNQSPTTTEVRRLLSYVWQFYLPRLGFMSPPLGRQDYGIREVMTERFYGAFAQLEVHFPAWVYDALWAAMGVVAVGAFAALVVHRRAVAARWDVAVVLAAAVVGLLGLLHTVAYRSLLNDQADPIIAGPLPAAAGRAVRHRRRARRLADPPALGGGGGGRGRGDARARAGRRARHHPGAVLCVAPHLPAGCSCCSWAPASS